MRCTETLDALNSLSPLDQEIIGLRHFEELSNDETAAVLEVGPAIAGRLYIRAMKHLTERMKNSTPSPTFQPFVTTVPSGPFSSAFMQHDHG